MIIRMMFPNHAPIFLALAYAKTYNLPVAVSRFGNIYSPGDLHFNRIIPGIMKAAINNEVLETEATALLNAIMFMSKTWWMAILFWRNR